MPAGRGLKNHDFNVFFWKNYVRLVEELCPSVITQALNWSLYLLLALSVKTLKEMAGSVRTDSSDNNSNLLKVKIQ